MQSFIATVLLSFSLTVVSPAATQSELAQELEEAKSLYQRANFIRALQALGAVVRVLDDRPDVVGGDAMRVDGHLPLGLTYFARQDAEAAKESFTNVVRIRPNYSLDADKYPPRVRALFEEARRDYDLIAAPPLAPRPG